MSDDRPMTKEEIQRRVVAYHASLPKPPPDPRVGRCDVCLGPTLDGECLIQQGVTAQHVPLSRWHRLKNQIIRFWKDET